jgi:hypothetical protein
MLRVSKLIKIVIIFEKILFTFIEKCHIIFYYRKLKGVRDEDI